MLYDSWRAFEFARIGRTIGIGRQAILAGLRPLRSFIQRITLGHLVAGATGQQRDPTQDSANLRSHNHRISRSSTRSNARSHRAFFKKKTERLLRVHFKAEGAIALKFVYKRSAADAESFGGFAAVEVVFTEGGEDGL